jgi:hypothetical protein
MIDDNPYEAPKEMPEGDEIPANAVTGAIVLWRFARFTFLSAFLVAAICSLGLIFFESNQRRSTQFSEIFATGLSFSVVALMIGGFLLIVSHVLVRRS